MKKCLYCILCAVLALVLSGCSSRPEPQPGPVMVEVYDDGYYTVDAGRPINVTPSDGGALTAVRLHIANRTDCPLVISTLLGVYVECGGQRLECRSYTPEASGTDAEGSIDGRIAPGYYADGWVSFPADYNGGALRMGIATDYCGGEWITFELPGAARTDQ